MECVCRSQVLTSQQGKADSFIIRRRSQSGGTLEVPIRWSPAVSQKTSWYLLGVCITRPYAGGQATCLKSLLAVAGDKREWGGMRAEGVHEGDNKKGFRTHFTVQVGPKFTALVLQPPGWPQPGLVHWGLTTVTQSRRGLTRGSESLAQLNEGLRARCTWNPRPDPLCDASIPHPFPLRATWRWEDLVLPSSRILNPRLHRPLPFPQRVWGG